MTWVPQGGRAAARFVLISALALALGGCASVDHRFRRAVADEQRGDYIHALAEYQDLLLRVDSADRARLAAVYLRAGECLWRLDQPNDALKAFANAAAAQPSNATAHLRIAEIYVGPAPARSLEELREVLALQPENAEAISVMGAAYSSAGQFALAKLAYQRALELDPTRATVAVALADLQYRELDTASARATLKNAADASPHSPVPWLALGRMEEQEGNADAAEEAYRHALAVDDSAETNVRLAQFLSRNSRIGEAEKILKHADALQPWLPTALPDFEFQSGRAYRAAEVYSAALQPGRLPAAPGAARVQRPVIAAREIEADLAVADGARNARRHLEQYRNELDPATVLVLQAEIALAEGDLVAARNSAQAAVQRGSDSAAAHYILGVVQHRSGDAADAQVEWQRALDQDTAFEPARLALAQQELRFGDPKAAEEYVALVLREEPANLNALCLYVRILTREKRYDAASAIAQRAVAADGAAVEPRIVMGELALARGNAGGALIDFEQALVLDPGSQEAIDGLVRVYRLGHITRPMLAKMEHAAATPPRSVTLMEIAGRLYRDHGWTADAERCFRAALAMDGPHALAATDLARTYAATGDLAQAESSLALSGADPAFLFAAFDAQRRNDTAGAIRDYELVVRRGDLSGVAANNLAWLYAEQHTNLDRALALGQQALERLPYNPRVLDTIGFVRMQRREYSEAVKVFQKAFDLARSPQSQYRGDPQLVAELRSHLAEAYRRAGQSDQAAALPE
jgi:tetratricopeptide (TPR) repeat protein